jgi:membrane associated rhomboid family serine protease
VHWPIAAYIAESAIAGQDRLIPRSRQPILNAPAAIRWLTGITVLVHIVRELLPKTYQIAVLEQFVFEPVRLAPAGSAIPAWLTTAMTSISHLFLHADLSHLVMNVAFLLAFGSAVARRMGAIQFILFYFLCGVFAAFFWSWLFPGTYAILLGASGAISGMVGAVARVSLWPPKHIGTALPFLRRRTVISFVMIWLVFTVALGIFPLFLPDDVGGIAWEAHIGGFLAGFVLITLFDGRGRLEPVARPVGML